MARRHDHDDDDSLLQGLGERSGSHRSGGGSSAFFSSLAAVLAVLLLLGGLYVAFGRDDGVDEVVGDGPGVSGSVRPPSTDDEAPEATDGTGPSVAPEGEAPTEGTVGEGTSGGETPAEEPIEPGDPASGDGEPTEVDGEGPGAGDGAELRDLDVVVLNQSGVAGAAASTAEELTGDGWNVSGVGNWRGSVPSTTVYYPDGAEAAAQVLAEAIGTERILPVFDGVSSSKLTIILV